MTTDPQAVGGLLLAAGGGRRFGRPKALVRFQGELLVERGARLLRCGGCDPVVVVLGAAAAAVRMEMHLPAADVVVNADWGTGMASSLRIGLRALEGRCSAAVVALADQPLVGKDAVARLIDAHRAGARAAVATYGGEPRNPVLLDAVLWHDAAAGAEPDAGARALLRDRPGLVQHVACDDTGSPEDVDTPEDLVALEGSAWPLRERSRPTERSASCN